MTDHEFLNDNRRQQRASYNDGTLVTVGFDAGTYEIVLGQTSEGRRTSSPSNLGRTAKMQLNNSFRLVAVSRPIKHGTLGQLQSRDDDMDGECVPPHR
jgi:hypothetical protein